MISHLEVEQVQSNDQQPQIARMRATGYRIVSVRVGGGFLDGLEFQFSDGLNCFIGARGAGKTTAVELIRYALDLLPGREAQAADRRRIDSLVEKNLAGGRVDVAVETKDGVSYVVRRVAGEEPIVMTADGQPTDIAPKANGFFRADIYSQNEVETIADRSLSQLVLMDNFEPDKIGDINARILATRTALASNAGRLLPLIGQISVIGDELATLAGIDEKLKQFAAAPGGDSDAINQAHAFKSLRDREGRAVSGARDLLTTYAKDVSSMTGRLQRQAIGLFASDLARSQNVAVLNRAQQPLTNCATEVDRLLSAIGAQLANAAKLINTASSDLRTAHQQQELAFQSLLEKDKQARGQAAERSQLERRRNELLAKQAHRQQLEQQVRELESERSQLLAELSELLDERFQVRKGVAARINESLSPAIRVTILQFGNPEQYLRLLEDSLRSARLKHLVVAQKLANAFWPIDLANVVRRRDAELLVQRADLNSEQAEKVLAALVGRETLFALEEVELADMPRIELRDGETYKESGSLSTGQKCTTILPILLLDSEHPLLVDQPEDNLDNRFIFETVVESIRHVKQQRQLIFVTHNPNIPVLGDAERVFVLDSDGQRARKANEGTVDQCKSDIVTLLEGGEDAFKARKRRYAY